MRLSVRADLASELLDFLRGQVDVVAARVGPGELEVSILGSLGALHDRAELARRVRRWSVESAAGPVELLEPQDAPQLPTAA